MYKVLLLADVGRYAKITHLLKKLEKITHFGPSYYTLAEVGWPGLEIYYHTIYRLQEH